MCLTRGSFVDLRNKLNSLILPIKFDIYRRIKQFNNTIHDKTKSRNIYLAKQTNKQTNKQTKTKDFPDLLTNYQFLMKRTQQKIRGQTTKQLSYHG